MQARAAGRAMRNPTRRGRGCQCSEGRSECRGMMLSPAELHAIARDAPLPWLLAEAERQTLAGHGRVISYSRKVFIPLTKLCRDVCHYCTFAERPKRGRRAYLTQDEVLQIARAGAAAGCHE